ncbi:ABC transporter ATP-binding protein [Spirochaeta cellobiosiphila]|uniref:ABC transporter ATP-binding protein n=1 Tax=Spirochaeta cellobiosiphila TaxID=504483 RepID=UPI00041AA440|nr:ATP-binding cassette domain-containing protein [Spirochaeta cellobiosiphila]
MVELQDLSLTYNKGKTKIFHALNYQFKANKIHILIGRSGCGKSSLLYLLAGLKRPQEGQIKIEGQEAQAGRKDISIILQEFGLFPWKTAYDNLLLGLKLRGIKKEVCQDKINKILKLLNLSGRENSYPHQLSGGEQQRLAIGRAVILDPTLLLLDEPFSSLDAMIRESMQDLLLILQNQMNRPTIIMVTHSIEEAVFLADYIHIMDNEGQLHSLPNHPEGKDYRLKEQYFNQCVRIREELERRSMNV